MLNIYEKMTEDVSWELERQGWRAENELHVIWGFGDRKMELKREYIGLLGFELDQLKRVEEKETIVVPSELVGKGKGMYVIYSRLRAEAYEFVIGL